MLPGVSAAIGPEADAELRSDSLISISQPLASRVASPEPKVRLPDVNSVSPANAPSGAAAAWGGSVAMPTPAGGLASSLVGKMVSTARSVTRVSLAIPARTPVRLARAVSPVG